MATRNVRKQVDALARARERRRELDRARDDQGTRIEEATASTLVALEARTDAESAVPEATARVGSALRLLLAEEVSVERAAALVDIDVADVRRFVRAASDGTDQESAEASSTPNGRQRSAKRTANLVELPRVE